MAPIRIEDSSKHRGFFRTTLEWSFTSLMWALWGYLFLPLVSLILWIAGLGYIYGAVFEESALTRLLELVSRMGWAVLIIFIVLRGWGYYNYYVFGRKNRRKHRDPVNLEKLGSHFGLTEQDVVALQATKQVYWRQSGKHMESGPQ